MWITSTRSTMLVGQSPGLVKDLRNWVYLRNWVDLRNLGGFKESGRV